MDTKNILYTLIALFSIAVFSCASGGASAAASGISGEEAEGKAPAQKAGEPSPGGAAPASPWFTGDGGKGMSLTIYAPKGTGLTKEQNYLLDRVRIALGSDFNKYSNIEVTDWKALEEVLIKNESVIYAENSDVLEVGKVTPSDYYLMGTVAKTTSNYSLDIQVTDKSSGKSRAVYSGNCSIEEFDNYTGIHKASAKLLADLGIALSDKAKQELAGASDARQVDAQTALAKGITAQRNDAGMGAAMMYFFQADAYDPSLLEASGRVSVVAANVSSGSLGEDTRNLINWRKSWIEELEKSNRFFMDYIANNQSPCEIIYSTSMETGAIDYNTETRPFTFPVRLFTGWAFYAGLERAVQNVTDGLAATKMNGDWNLHWPGNFVNSIKPIAYDVDFDLVNANGVVIGSKSVRLGFSWGISGGNSIEVSRPNPGAQRVTIIAKAAGITDTLTIKVRAINGKDPQEANVRLSVISGNPGDDNDYRFDLLAGELWGAGSNIKTVPAGIWERPVVSIGNGAYREKGLTSITIPGNIISIKDHAFDNNPLTGVTIPGNVKIGSQVFRMETVENPAKNKDGRDSGGAIEPGFVITMGANVSLEQNSFYTALTKVSTGTSQTNAGTRYNYYTFEKNPGKDQAYYDGSNYYLYMDCSGSAEDLYGFTDFYNGNGRKAGTYTFTYLRKNILNLPPHAYQWFYNP